MFKRSYHGDQVWLCHQTWIKEKSPKLLPSWEGSQKVIIQIIDVVYRIQNHHRTKIMVVHLDNLMYYLRSMMGSLEEGAVSQEWNGGGGGSWPAHMLHTIKTSRPHLLDHPSLTARGSLRKTVNEIRDMTF
jgi:hypothetical protein